MAAKKRKPAKRGRAQAQRVLALDISSKCWGWAVFDGEALTDHGRIILKGDCHGPKLHQCYMWLAQAIETLEPQVVLFEKPFPGGRANAFGVLMMYAGLIRLLHVRHYGEDIPGEQMVPPHLVKRALRLPKPKKMSKAKASEHNKKIVLMEINRIYRLSLKFKADDRDKKISQDDEADAIALGHYWLQRGEVADDE